MRNSIPDLYLSGQGEYFDALRENIYRADAGETTSEQALEQCAKQWRRITRKKGRANQIRQWNFLRKRYPENLQNRLR